MILQRQRTLPTHANGAARDRLLRSRAFALEYRSLTAPSTARGECMCISGSTCVWSGRGSVGGGSHLPALGPLLGHGAVAAAVARGDEVAHTAGVEECVITDLFVGKHG